LSTPPAKSQRSSRRRRRRETRQAPFAEVDALRQSGLLKLLVPVEDGGLGGRWTDALEVTRTIASGDGSIGQLIGYHYVNSLTPELAGTPEQGAAYRRQVAKHNWFVADSVNPLDPGLTARKEGGRFILNGSKSFSTGALIADSIVIADWRRCGRQLRLVVDRHLERLDTHGVSRRDFLRFASASAAAAAGAVAMGLRRRPTGSRPSESWSPG
jgi:alkylation response protein AidB-like acyl-CoA dehydrogenase